MMLVSGLLSRYAVHALAGGLAVSVAVGAWGHWRAHTTQTALAKLQAAVQQARADAEAETTRRTEAIQEVTRYAAQSRARIEADRHAADDGAQRLRQRVAELLAAHPSSTSGGKTGASTDDLPAQLLSGAEERLRALAAEADATRAAGDACQRAYQSLTR